MNLVILNSTDIIGGAARAAYRIHKGFQSQGVNSVMLVQTKASDDSTVIGPLGKINKAFNQIRPYIDSLPLKLYPNRANTEWDLGWLPKRITGEITRLNPDIINLNWISGGFLPWSILRKFNKPLVWTLHDCWAFTGGCHYTLGCTKYQKNCGSCPQLRSKYEWDLSRWAWRQKSKNYEKRNLTIVMPSRWLAQLVKHSSLLGDVRIEVIPYCIDLTMYKPINKYVARDILNLPHDKQLVLFSSSNSGYERKGFHHLKQALQYIYETRSQKDLKLVKIGPSLESELMDTGFECLPRGKFSDDITLSLFYASADVFVAPSIEDNLPLTVLEALACGTPTVAFDIGGMPDLIDHQQNGYLAQPFDTEDLAHGIEWVLSDKNRKQTLGQKARSKMEQECSIYRVTNKYLTIYEDILRNS